jgi:hypothetical protein
MQPGRPARRSGERTGCRGTAGRDEEPQDLIADQVCGIVNYLLVTLNGETRALADPAYAFPLETEWLREYLETFAGTVYFDTEAAEEMRRSRVSQTSVLYVMRHKPVVDSDPDPSGARWVVEGEDEHDRLLTITLNVEVSVQRVEVIAVLVG